MEKINVAELLKDCPKGMELDCAMYETVTLNRVLDGLAYPIRIETPDGLVLLNEYGCYSRNEHAKCIIFPKGKTTWEGFQREGFQRPFKDGDIVTWKNRGSLVACIYKERKNNAAFYHHIATYGSLGIVVNGEIALTNNELCFATEEEKEKLFKAIKDNGYKWNEETKALEKLVESKFRKGDWIMIDKPCQIISINDNGNYIVQYCDAEKKCEISKDFCETHFHLWTIQDAKDGDVLAVNWHQGYDYWEKIIIFKKYRNVGTDRYVEGYGNTFKNGKLAFNFFEFEEVPYYSKSWTRNLHPATKEQRELLFQTIKENGYKWNSVTKTLVKLIQPKFKVGDKVRHKNNHNVVFTITSIDIEEDSYGCGIATAFWFDNQDDYELVPNKFDITTLKPFDRVLARCSYLEKWRIQFFEKYDKTCKYPFICMGYNKHEQCIPYEGNEHLLDTVDNCDEFYKNWK